jgi:tetratricopeptide (TPR) repeat protein
MYEMSTGRLPYDASTAPDFARKIVEGQPISPNTINPSIDKAILGIFGRCLYKDQFRREKDAKTILEHITKAEPEAARFAAELVSKGSGTSPGVAVSADPDAKQAILLIADVANYDEVAASDPEGANRAASRMQQLLGEAVYLFDGQVLDPFGRRMIAEMPTVENALEAARKGEFDFSPGQQEAEPVLIRLLLHHGLVTSKDGVTGGDGVVRGTEVLSQLPAGALHLTEEFLKKGRGSVRVRDAGAKGGVKLFTIAPAEAPQPKVEHVSTEELDAQEAAEAEAEMQAILAAAKKRRSRAIGIGIAAAVILALIAGAVMFSRSKAQVEKPATATVIAQAQREAPKFARVVINPITVEGPDPLLPERANAIRLGAIEILQNVAGVQVSETTGRDVLSFGATLRTGAAGPEMVTQTPGATPVPVPDAASGIRDVLDWVRATAHVAINGMSDSPVALNAYADALSATAANDAIKAQASLKAAVAADPNFLPAQLLAMRYFSTHGDAQSSLDAAKQIVALDPSNLDAARLVARTTLSLGDVQSAFSAYKNILHANAGDLEALTHVARYALSAGDLKTFNAARARMQRIPPASIPVHEPDQLANAGRFQQAIDQYFLLEEKVPNNPALTYKIGKFSVLNHSLPIADIELAKLQQSDPTYGYHLLKAFIAAHGRNTAEALQELDEAGKASTPGDDYWTSVAEVHVLLGENDKVLESLEKAVARKEPTANYMMHDPLFAYLARDEHFLRICQVAAAGQQEIRTALAQLVI